MKITNFLFSMVVAFFVIGCSEKPKNILVHNTVIKIPIPKNYCFTSPNTEPGLLLFDIYRNIAPDSTFYQILVNCEDLKYLKEKGSYQTLRLAIVTTVKKLEQVNFSDSKKNFAKRMYEESISTKNNVEFQNKKNELKNQIEERIPIISEMNELSVDGAEYDELAAYIPSIGITTFIDGQKDSAINTKIFTLVRGKALILYIVSTIADAKTKNITREFMKEWVSEIHERN